MERMRCSSLGSSRSYWLRRRKRSTSAGSRKSSRRQSMTEPPRRSSRSASISASPIRSSGRSESAPGRGFGSKVTSSPAEPLERERERDFLPRRRGARELDRLHHAGEALSEGARRVLGRERLHVADVPVAADHPAQ